MEESLVQFLITGRLGNIGIGTHYKELLTTFGTPAGETKENDLITGVAYGHLFFGISRNVVDSISLKWDSFMPNYVGLAQAALERVGIQWYSETGKHLKLQAFVQRVRHENIQIRRLIPVGQGDWGTILVEIAVSNVVVGFDEDSGLIEGIWQKGSWPASVYERRELN